MRKSNRKRFSFSWNLNQAGTVHCNCPLQPQVTVTVTVQCIPTAAIREDKGYASLLGAALKTSLGIHRPNSPLNELPDAAGYHLQPITKAKRKRKKIIYITTWIADRSPPLLFSHPIRVKRCETTVKTA